MPCNAITVIESNHHNNKITRHWLTIHHSRDNKSFRNHFDIFFYYFFSFNKYNIFWQIVHENRLNILNYLIILTIFFFSNISNTTITYFNKLENISHIFFSFKSQKYNINSKIVIIITIKDTHIYTHTGIEI